MKKLEVLLYQKVQFIQIQILMIFWKDKHPQYPIEPSQPSQPSLQENTILAAAAVAAAAVAKSIYSMRPHSDIFGCEGDKWEMQQHPCKGVKK
jgi:hypothetical protein